MSSPSPVPLTGAQKAAIALMAVDDDTAASLFKHLREDEMEKVAREIAAIGSVSPELGEQVLSELNTSATGIARAAGRHGSSSTTAVESTRAGAGPPSARTRRRVSPHRGGFRLDRTSESRAVVEILPRRTPADHRADPGAPECQQRGSSSSSSCRMICGRTCCCGWPPLARFRRTWSPASPP